MADSEIVEVVNRTESVLSYTKNGRQKSLKPGPNHIPNSHVRFALTQNALMGTEDPMNPTKFTSLVGVPGNNKYPCSQIVFTLNEDRQLVALFENGKEMVVPTERIDRSKLPEGRQKATVEAAHYPISRYNLGPMENNVDTDAGFTASTAGE